MLCRRTRLRVCLSSLASLPLRCGSAELANDPGHLSTCIDIPRESAGRIAHFESTVLQIPTAGLYISSFLQCLGSSGHVISLSCICSSCGALLKMSVAKSLLWLDLGSHLAVLQQGWRSSTQTFAVVVPSLRGGLACCKPPPSSTVVPGWPRYDDPKSGTSPSSTRCNVAGGRTTAPWKGRLGGRYLQLQGRMVRRHPRLCVRDTRCTYVVGLWKSTVDWNRKCGITHSSLYGNRCCSVFKPTQAALVFQSVAVTALGEVWPPRGRVTKEHADRALDPHPPLTTILFALLEPPKRRLCRDQSTGLAPFKSC